MVFHYYIYIETLPNSKTTFQATFQEKTNSEWWSLQPLSSTKRRENSNLVNNII